MYDFSANLKKLRKKAGLSQSALAKKLNVSQTAIYYWENGKREPDLDMLFKISDYFNTDVPMLLGLNDNSSSEIERILSQNPSQYGDFSSFSFEKLTDSEVEELEKCSEVLYTSFFTLNLLGKKEAAKRVEELTHIEKYTKKD